MTISIFDCCDVCAASLTAEELEAGERYGHMLCDGCADEFQEANGGEA